jgi:dihydroorotate dehydrogenase
MTSPGRANARIVVACAVERLKQRAVKPVPIVANVGGFSSETIAAGVLEVGPHVDAVEISLMCPNVLKPGETFDEVGMLRGILDRIDGNTASTIVRVPNDTTQSHDRFAELVELCVEAKVGGLKIGGGRRLAEPRLGTGIGTLHGRAIFDTAFANADQRQWWNQQRVRCSGDAPRWRDMR